MDKSLQIGEFEQVALLVVLRLQDDGAYGVTIRAEIAKRTQRDTAPGALYTTLDRLEQKGLVNSKVGEATPARGGRPKRFYYVTAKGVEALKLAKRVYDNLADGLAF